MKLSKNLGMILLSIWLILTGLFTIISFNFDGREIAMAILAIASGVLLLFGK